MLFKLPNPYNLIYIQSLKLSASYNLLKASVSSSKSCWEKRKVFIYFCIFSLPRSIQSTKPRPNSGKLRPWALWFHLTSSAVQQQSTCFVIMPKIKGKQRTIRREYRDGWRSLWHFSLPAKEEWMGCVPNCSCFATFMSQRRLSFLTTLCLITAHQYTNSITKKVARP